MPFLKNERGLPNQAGGHKGTTLQRRLISFFAVVVICVVLAFTLLLTLFGITGSGRQTVHRYLESELLHISSAAEEDLGNLSVTGIQLAEELTREARRISGELDVPLPELIARRDPALLSAQMNALLSVAEHNPCGGVFLVLDVPAAGGDKLPGIFIKKTQPVSSASLAAKTYCLRGNAEIARSHSVELLAQWQMDYDSDELPFFQTVLDVARDNADLPLSRLYYWSGRILLNGNSETGILLSLPLMADDGTVYGICGIEVSDRMFKQLYSPGESAYQSVFALAAPGTEQALYAESGLMAGNSYLTGIQMTSSLFSSGTEKDFRYFAGERGTYGGLLRQLKLYPTGSPYLSEQWVMAVLMPRNLLDDAIRGNSAVLFAIAALLLVAGLTGCFFLSRRYLRPIHKGLSSIRQGAYETETAGFGVVEIDDLFADLARNIRQHREELQQLRLEQEDAQAQAEKVQAQMEKTQTRLDRLTDKKMQEIDPDEFELFLTNLKQLTATERRIFDLYLEGKTPKEIMELLQIKDNTLKYHNRNIYGKLGVTSRKHLLQFAALMEQSR